jgi:O-palmitoleoyl-L-serine hydrolase
MVAAWLAGAALAQPGAVVGPHPPLGAVDFGPECAPIPQGEDRWWWEGRPGHSMARVEVDTEAHPRALCNDGTPAIYYVRAGAETDRWVVHLQGGGMCFDQATCLARWCDMPASDYSGELMSSAWSHETLLTGGIFDPDPVRNRFAAWNHVFVHYCSSDGFLGQAADVDLEDPEAPERNYRIHFLGREILDAVLDELQHDPAEGLPSLGSARTVLVTGTTAGGIGVISSLDRVAATLRASNPGVDVRGVIDSAAYPAADTAAGAPYTGTWDAESLWRYEALALPALWGSVRDDSCAAAHAGTGDGWWCDERMHALTSHVATPFFAASDQLDVENPLCQGDPACAPLLRAQFEAFAGIADATIPREVPPEYPASAPLPGSLLSRCSGGGHAVLTWRDSAGFLDRKVPVGAYQAGASTWVSLHDALWSWVEDDGGPTTVIREADEGAQSCPDPPPSAPSGVTAAYDVGADTVSVSWGVLPFATTVRVSFAEDPASAADGPSLAPAPVGDGVVEDVRPTGTRRCYVARGANAEGEGPPSAASCVDLPGHSVEGAPPGCGCGAPQPLWRPWGVGVLALAAAAMGWARR